MSPPSLQKDDNDNKSLFYLTLNITTLITVCVLQYVYSNTGMEENLDEAHFVPNLYHF